MTARRVLVATLVPLLLGACSTAGAQPTSGGNGYVGTGENFITQVPPASRIKAPDASGPALGSGKPVSTASYRGKVVVLNVWYSSCAPCRKEAPDLQQASAQTARKAQFVGINSRDTSAAQAQAFVRAHGLTYPSIYDPKGSVLLNFSGSLPLSTFPSTLLIDRQGRIAVRISGPITKITLVNLVDDVASGH